MKCQLLLFSALEAFQASIVASATIYLAGDSTMAAGGGGSSTQGKHHIQTIDPRC
jgi:rhamnogalacturonan acetylesterase